MLKMMSSSIWVNRLVRLQFYVSFNFIYTSHKKKWVSLVKKWLVFKKFTRAYLFQIVLEIIWLPILIIYMKKLLSSDWLR